MPQVKSSRAQALITRPRFFKSEASPLMRKYPGKEFELWLQVELEQNSVKNLSFAGPLQDWQQVVLESMASLMLGKPLSRLEQLSLRECEAFLRDRNSEFALAELPASADDEFKKLFTWIRLSPAGSSGEIFEFSSEKGPFRNLKLADKIRELKAFLNSQAVASLYEGSSRPELVDVEDLTVYVEAPYASESERARFEELHLLGVEAFQEESLNFIPEA